MNNQNEKSALPDDKPFVSVIMPVFNEESFIEKSLSAILNQDYPHDLMEVIVADGMSTDMTRELIKQQGILSDISISVIDNPEKFAPFALNYAIEHSKGEIIVRVDGHCEIATDYVSNCVKHLTAGKAEGVGGPIETIGESGAARAIAIAMSSVFGVGGSAFRTVDDQEVYVDTVAFPGYTKEVIEKTGPFNVEMVRNQDDEYNYRIRKNGGRILLAPDVRSRYFSRSGFKSLWSQYFQYGYWKIRVLQLHPKQMSLRQFIPFVFVSSLFVLAFLGLFFSAARWLLLIELILYVCANLIATIKTAGRTGIFSLPAISLSFAILHISYGLGFAAGLVAFRNRWNRKNNGEINEP